MPLARILLTDMPNPGGRDERPAPAGPATLGQPHDAPTEGDRRLYRAGRVVAFAAAGRHQLTGTSRTGSSSRRSTDSLIPCSMSDLRHCITVPRRLEDGALGKQGRTCPFGNSISLDADPVIEPAGNAGVMRSSWSADGVGPAGLPLGVDRGWGAGDRGTVTGLMIGGAAYFWQEIFGFFSGLTRKPGDEAATLEKSEPLRRVA